MFKQAGGDALAFPRSWPQWCRTFRTAGPCSNTASSVSCSNTASSPQANPRTPPPVLLRPPRSPPRTVLPCPLGGPWPRPPVPKAGVHRARRGLEESHMPSRPRACGAMSENHARRKCSRHIDILRYFVRDLVAAWVQKLVPLGTNLMVADALITSNQACPILIYN